MEIFSLGLFVQHDIIRSTTGRSQEYNIDIIRSTERKFSGVQHPLDVQHYVFRSRYGKSLQNSTGKTLILKNLHTKYVEKKALKNSKTSTNAKKLHTKIQKPLKMCV